MYHSLRMMAALSIVLIMLGAVVSKAQTASGSDDAKVYPADLAAARAYYLSDLLQPHNYTPGKNSYLFQSLQHGTRRTVLKLDGAGSVRHMWFTWSVPGSDDVPANIVRIRIYLNHESQPSVDTTVGQLCHAAKATGTRFVPFPAFIYKDAYNIYLPVYFANGIRIELEAIGALSELYTQIDFRRGPDLNEHLRLQAHRDTSGIALDYAGQGPLLNRTSNPTPALQEQHQLCAGNSGTCSMVIKGQGILRRLAFQGDIPEDLELSIYWDGEADPSVVSPFKYLFSDFNSAAFESVRGQKSCYLPMPFRHEARIVLRSPSREPIHIEISYALAKQAVSVTAPYFHAAFHSEQNTVGYRQYEIAHIKGSGLFVGLNLYDSGHNHGGGDAALIDGASNHPHVLHGICGEDYFGFAWHHTGMMTPLTGAPAHERRYRLHLENPYPFHQSLSFLFGTFASQNPKSVAIWYQNLETQTTKRWSGVDAPWKVFGPIDSAASPLDGSGDVTYNTVIPINKPTEIQAQWQDTGMEDGFIDLTYIFRHYVLTKSGSGFVVGTSRAKLVTYVHSTTAATVNAILGQDDGAQIQINEKLIAQLHPSVGFAGSMVRLPLRSGWNKLTIILANDENSDWRWLGMSLAFQKTKQSAALTFSPNPPSASLRADIQ